MASQPADSVPITSLPPQHLARVRDQLANDVDELADSHAMLGRLAARSCSAARAVETLAESKTEQPLLLPLTSSLYVKGKVADTEKVLVNIGTDYYVEMSIEKATDYCRRKVLYLQKQQQAVYKVVQEKRNALAQVTAVLQEKVKSLQAAQAGSSSVAS
eukprot:GHUV01004241.1.p2 GENE.GHUV01004241.1~~GHUV01004241.1.p2  ORF type:complete len:159 (+),score=48.47 GHUV01004241.1:656-1132(+)